jgi:hypothetical protein
VFRSIVSSGLTETVNFNLCSLSHLPSLCIMVILCTYIFRSESQCFHILQATDTWSTRMLFLYHWNLFFKLPCESVHWFAGAHWVQNYTQCLCVKITPFVSAKSSMTSSLYLRTSLHLPFRLTALLKCHYQCSILLSPTAISTNYCIHQQSLKSVHNMGKF